MFKNNSTDISIFKIVGGNFIIIILVFAYALWFYNGHLKNDLIISDLYNIKNNISEINQVRYTLSGKAIYDKGFSDTEKSEKNEVYESKLKFAKQTIESLKVASYKDNELTNLYNSLITDINNIESKHKLLLKYLNEAGNTQSGIYSHLIIAEKNFIDKTNTYYGLSDILTYFKHITVYSKVFYLYNDITILNITNNHINGLLKKLNYEKNNTNSTKYLRLIDGLLEYKQVFNLFARKLMQIGISENTGINNQLAKSYIKFDKRIDTAIELIEQKQKKESISTAIIILVIVLLSIFVSIVLYYRIIKRIKLFIKDSENFFISIIKGNLIETPTKIPNDDFTELQNQMAVFEKKISVTSTMLKELAGRGAISGGDNVFDNSIFPQVKSIDKHIKSLNKQLKSETNQTLINEWIRKGLASFSDVLRKNFDKPQQHAKEILSNLVGYLNIPMGAIYLPSPTKENTFDLVGSIAYGKTKNYNRSVILGEGIVGTVAKEKKTINITDIPEDYFKVSSGFGESKPKNIIAIPIKLENKVFGIVELASLNKFKKFELEFIDELSNNLGASFAITDIFLKTKEKLKSIEKEYSLVKSKSELYESEIDSLKEENSYFESRNVESEIVNNSIQSIALVAELDLEGYILNLNNAFIELLKIPEEKLRQTNYWDFISNEENDKKIDFKKFRNDVRAGRLIQFEQYFLVADRKVWLSETYIPIKRKTGKVEKIKVIAFNKTDFKLLETKSRNFEERLDESKKILDKKDIELKKANEKTVKLEEEIITNIAITKEEIAELKNKHDQILQEYINQQQEKESALYEQINKLRSDLENLKK